MANDSKQGKAGKSSSDAAAEGGIYGRAKMSAADSIAQQLAMHNAEVIGFDPSLLEGAFQFKPCFE